MSKKLLIVGKVVLEKPRRGYLLCERYRYFIVMAVMMALMLPCVANESVHLAAKTALESMTGKNLAKLYKARTEADNSNQREVIVQACIAGLYAIGDSKNAKKISQGVNSAEFVESFMRECDLCYGGGSSQEGCYKCNGSGACQNRKCNKGIVISEGFDGRSNARKCSNCGGSGRCVNCKGTGKIVRPCSRCNGSKRVINKTIALASCKDMLNALIACGNEIQCRKKAEGTSRLAQQMVEKEKQAREKAESDARLAEQRAQNEKRQREQAEENIRLARQRADSERRARVKAEGDVRLAQQNAENEKRAREKAEKDASLAEQNAKDEKLEREKAEETVRLAQTNAAREKQAREEAESNARLAEQNAETEKRQREKAEENVRLAQQKVENEKRVREKVEENVRLAQSKAEGGNNVRGGAVVVPDNAKGSGRTKVVLPADKGSLKTAFPNSYKKIESVVIQDGVTSIENSAFEDCSSLRSVIIPKGVTSIGSQAFKGCSGLTSVVIPDGVTHIYSFAFEGCTGLTSVVIPDSVTDIGDCVFSGCTGLTSLTIPNNVTSIDGYAFKGCSGLTKVVIGKDVTWISSTAFDGCSGVTNVTMPACMRLRSVFPDAYETIQCVDIHNGDTRIVYDAFKGCTGLISVVIPNSVTSIESDAFEGCSGLRNVTIPDSVTSIGHGAFKGCTGLTSVVIPNSVTSIGGYAFSGCSALTSVTLPQSLKKLGSRAFERCEKLESFGNKVFKGGDISTEAFAETKYAVIEIDGVKCIKSIEDAVQIKQRTEFEKKLAKITSAIECFSDGCNIHVDELLVSLLKRRLSMDTLKSEGFNYVVSGTCNGVPNTRLQDINYLLLSEGESTVWMNALKIAHAKVIEWVAVAAENDIDKVEKEIPIGFEVLAHSNTITYGRGQQELFLSAIRERAPSETPVTFFCKIIRNDYGKHKGEYSGWISARCGYFNHVILSFSGDKTSINNDILLLLERYKPEVLKKAYLEYEKKQDLFK